MDDEMWNMDLQWRETSLPTQIVKDEEILTLYLSDFLKMPDLDYRELARFDPLIKSLFN